MSAFLLHQFSPQRTEPQILEETLVSRRGLLDEVVSKLRASAEGSGQHHFLLVGPRGIGKTNFLTLVHHELVDESAGEGRLRLAWLHEDEMSTTFLALAVRIYRALSSAYPVEFSPRVLEAIRGQKPEDALARATEALGSQAKRRKVLILMENLDAHLTRMKPLEQKRWRAFLQNHSEFVTLATAQKLTTAVSKRSEPFFNFFDVRQLKPFTVEEARNLLIRIAEVRRSKQDENLIQFLKTPRGEARLRAIHWLAGGNPRLYVLLSELLTREGLDDVVRAFEEMVDRQLTAYYQERLRWLSPQQQEIVHELCRARSPISVKGIAEGIFATNQTVSRQLKELSDMGYVQSHAVGRESAYELSEPLMRLVLEAKQGADRRQLGLIVEFLRLWFEPHELEARLAVGASDLTKRYLEEALREAQRATVQVAVRPATIGAKLGAKVRAQLNLLSMDGSPADRALAASNLLEQEGLPPELRAFALLVRTFAQVETSDTNGALEDSTSALNSAGTPSYLVPWLHMARSAAFRVAGDLRSALREVTEALNQAAPEDVEAMRLRRAHLLHALGEHSLARAELEQLRQASHLSRDLENDALILVAELHQAEGAWQEELAILDRILGHDDLEPALRWRSTLERAKVLTKVGGRDLALQAYGHAISTATSPGEVSGAWAAQAVAHEEWGEVDLATQCFESAGHVPGLSAQERSLNLTRQSFHRLKHNVQGALEDANEAVRCADLKGPAGYLPYRVRGVVHDLQDEYPKALADYQVVLDHPAAPGAMRAFIAVFKARLLLRMGEVAAAGVALDEAFAVHEQGELSVAVQCYKPILSIQIEQAAHTFRQGASRLVAIAGKTGELGKLGAELVAHLNQLRLENPDPAKLKAWSEAWAAAGAEHPELTVPLRLLHAGLAYLVERDERKLLGLALEERRLLRSALDLDR